VDISCVTESVPPCQRVRETIEPTIQTDVVDSFRLSEHSGEFGQQSTRIGIDDDDWRSGFAYPYQFADRLFLQVAVDVVERMQADGAVESGRIQL